MTDVVAALIWDNDRFLICQRPAHKARGMLWEFVGGKVEPGETPEQALIRECREELDVVVKPSHLFMELIHEYPDITVRLSLYHARIIEGVPQMLEHNDIRWIRTSEIDQYTFCPADADILLRLKQFTDPLHAHLLEVSDPEYRAFQSKLMPTVSFDRILGVRMPDLRKVFSANPEYFQEERFLTNLPHKFYEEDNLHGILISAMTDFYKAISALDEFLPYVDNWATCDLIKPMVFANKQQLLLPHIKRWLQSRHNYTVRFALSMLMHFYLDGEHAQVAMDLAASIRSDDYYVNMMIAWFFATALFKQYEIALEYLTQNRLNQWTHNKAIQKAIESKRITQEQKAHLKTLKRNPEGR